MNLSADDWRSLGWLQLLSSFSLFCVNVVFSPSNAKYWTSVGLFSLFRNVTKRSIYVHPVAFFTRKLVFLLLPSLFFSSRCVIIIMLVSITYSTPCISHCGSMMHYVITVLLLTRFLLCPLIHYCMPRFVQYPTFSCGQNHYVCGASEEVMY